MKKYLYFSAFLFGVVSIAAFLARHLGWYNDYFFTDIILHTISGVALGSLWKWIEKENITPRTFLIGAGSFATFGSVLWEYWEYAGYLLTRSSVPFYVPQLSDTLGDILCGMIGGFACAIAIIAIEKSKK